ncbi:hypothetical protein RJT34_09430 [Clitoria ternatea]|uniref:Uncharacterized protein n=1 Tax=Clitoria ternatea TaxID=43366 RepID=A0AAN9K8U1_CLITE
MAFYIEEAAEVVWERFLEADNAVEVLMRVSKGIMGHLQVIEFNLNGSMQRENELKSKVQYLMELTRELNFIKGSASTTGKKVGSLEKELREKDIQLMNVKASSEVREVSLLEHVARRKSSLYTIYCVSTVLFFVALFKETVLFFPMDSHT